MNKEDFTSILQVSLFCFDGATKEEIKKLNPEYNSRLINAGCSLCTYLKGLKLEINKNEN